MTLIRKDSAKGGCIDNFQHITLLNTQLKIFAKVLAERLACLVDGLIGAEQKCAVPGRNIQNNLHLLRYSLEVFESNSGKSEALLRLDQAKLFDMVDHH